MAICPECHRQFPDDVADCPDHGVPLVPDSVFANVDRELEPGTQIGDYEVESMLGQGAFGRVYRAVHPVIGRRVAIKVLGRALCSDPQAVSRFISEARALVEINSPYIVDIYSFGSLGDGSQYYVMDLLDGSSLSDFLHQRGALEPQVALRILDGIAEALSAAHAADVVHRDLKPDNVFIAFSHGGEPVPKLLDFGVAKLIGKPGLGHRTTTGVVIGTPAYMAPEQALGLPVDHRSDIYAFGIVAFEMLAGRAPFEADSLAALLQQHAVEQPPAVSSLRPEIGAAFDQVVAQMLHKEPASRPATIEVCREELRAIAAEAGLEMSLPDLASLRPAPLAPSQPGAPTPTWDEDTVPADEQDGAPPARPQDGAAADTVGGTAGAADLVVAPRHRQGLGVRVAVAVAALAAVVAGSIMLTRSPAPVDGVPASASERKAAISAEVVAAPSEVASAIDAATIELRVETTAKGARVFLDGRDKGAAPGVIAIDRGEEAVHIEVRAAGYETAKLTIVPSADQVVSPALTPAKMGPGRMSPQGKPSSTPTAAASVSPEIEPPSWVGK